MIPVLAMQVADPVLEVLNTDVRTFGGTDATSPDMIGGWIVCFLTLAVFSFLYRDNPFYKFAEHLFVGVGTAWYTLQYYEEGILQPLVEQIEQARHVAAQSDAGAVVGNAAMMSLGGVYISPTTAIVLRIVPIVLSLMLLVRLFKTDSWMPRWPLALMVGIYAALKMTGETQSKLVLQISESFVPIESVGRVVFLVGLICALSHFLFTFGSNPVQRGLSRVGVITLMITFGSMFGFTVLGRIALLIERIADLDIYWSTDYGIGGVSFLSPPAISGLLIALLLAVWATTRGRSNPTA